MGTLKPSRVNKQLLQRALRFSALVCLRKQRVEVILWRHHSLCLTHPPARVNTRVVWYCGLWRILLPVADECIGDGLADELTVLLQRVEGILDRLVDGFLDGATHLLNLIHTAAGLRGGTVSKVIELTVSRELCIIYSTIQLQCSSYLVGIRNIDGGHVETTFVESWSLAELLHYLHHYSLRKTDKYTCQ